MGQSERKVRRTWQQRPAAGQQAGDAADAQGVRSVQRALDILSLLTEDRPSVSIREIVERPGWPRRRCSASCPPWSRAGCCGRPRAATWPVPACGAGRIWPGAAGSCRRRRSAMMRDLGRPAPRDRQPVRRARHLPGLHRAAGEPAAAAARRPRRRRAAAVGRCLGQGAAPRRAASPAGPGRAQLAVRRGPRRDAAGVDRRGRARRVRGEPRRTRGRPVRGRRADPRPLRRGRRRARAERTDAAVHRGPGRRVRRRPQAGRRPHVRARVRPSRSARRPDRRQRAPAGARKEYAHAATDRSPASGCST